MAIPGQETQDQCEQEDEVLEGVSEAGLHHPVGVSQTIAISANCIVNQPETNINGNGEPHAKALNPRLIRFSNYHSSFIARNKLDSCVALTLMRSTKVWLKI